jgi:hypothetical protein
MLVQYHSRSDEMVCGVDRLTATAVAHLDYLQSILRVTPLGVYYNGNSQVHSYITRQASLCPSWLVLTLLNTVH